MFRSAFVAVALLYAAASTAMSVIATVGIGEWPSAGERALVALLTLAGAALIVVGLRARPRSRPLAVLAVAVGTVPLAFGLWWTVVLPVLAGIVVVAALVDSFVRPTARTKGTFARAS